ncbi:carbon monoxide dehydrogenase subunit G [Hypericibacter adhaerens]|uniref:Carbon monoxide dehydrogenase subunit G n=1 Tax=Hypericibacter adhaerens TaxID=2602016 RepID=A0A5J6MU17_9PROT|nr:SRPBCC family protein [Hypericibacter adhaerens]QEX21118.1 carbon monoxide dehydrogenase subunit G [Hypericibacter adhaerens]
MKIENSFDVPLPVEQTWDLLLDIQRVAPCLPGAELLETIDSDAYRGKVSVKLGPMAVTFQGIARFESKDPVARRANVKASGNETKGRGGAQAKVDFALTSVPGSGTRVKIDTDLNLNGAVAQYGRASGMIGDVAQQLVDKFAEALKAQIQADAARAAPAVTGEPSPTGAANTTAPVPPATPPAPAKPISATELLIGALKRRFRRWLAGLRGRGPEDRR